MSWPLAKEAKTYISASVFLDCTIQFCKITDLSLQIGAAVSKIPWIMSCYR